MCLCLIYCLSVQRLGEPKDEHCVLQCTYKSYYICDPIPLDNPKNHIALPYITWGLIQDLKNKKEILPQIKFEDKAEVFELSEFFTGLPFGISKIRERISTWRSHEERRKILVVKPIVESLPKTGKVNHHIQAMGMS